MRPDSNSGDIQLFKESVDIKKGTVDPDTYKIVNFGEDKETAKRWSKYYS